MAQPRARALLASLRLLQRAVEGAAIGHARVGGAGAGGVASTSASAERGALAHARQFHAAASIAAAAAAARRPAQSPCISAAASAATAFGPRGGRRWSSSAADAAAAAPTASPSAATSEGVTLTDAAVARLQQLARDAGGRPVALRIEVEGGGCSGFQYVLRLEEGAKAQNPLPGDSVFEREGARLLVDEVSLGLLKGSVVDYEDTLMRSAFHVASNPNSEASCGCGSSFAAKL